jgi:non-specific serine/threonine protein kinase/serine/threonine-protein kinase
LEPTALDAYLSEACAGANDLEAEVRSLLASSREADGLLEDAVAHELEALAAPPGKIGPYTLLAEIGRGGMGTVHLAERSDAEYEGRVAIKLVSRGMDSDLVLRRFRAERQILAGLAHPNIARLLDGGTTAEGLPYFVMEYVEGTHILEYARAARLSLAEGVQLFRGVCDAVSFAHAKLVVHLDIKPGNILVTPAGIPKLLDFGVARIVDPRVARSADPTVAAHRMLTPEYASPEQIRGERLTTASDIYSLGVVLYRLLTGRPVPEPLRSVRGELGEDLDTILEKALRKDPERRYPSVEQLSEDLRRHLAGLPVLARRDTFSYRARKFVRRHAAAVAASVLVVASIVGAGGIAVVQARRALRNEALAEKRFAELRSLARTVMYELHDGVQPLPGSTPVRALLVATSLRYLNALAKDAGRDPSLLRELADGYMRIGEVQGGQNQGNLGDTAGALTSLEKSLAIREALHRADPANEADRERLAEGLTRTALALLRTGRLDDALANARRAVAVRAALLSGTVASRLALAFSHHALGDALLETGDLEAALIAFRRETALYEAVSRERSGDVAARSKVAVGLYKTGAAAASYGDFATALPLLARAAAVAVEVSRTEPGNANYQRYVTFAHGALAAAEIGTGRRDAALAHYREALALREAMVAADPSNANLSMFLAALRAEYGAALVANGHRERGLELLASALPRLEEIARRDPANIEARYQTALAFADEARARAHLGDCAGADGSYARSLESFDALKGALRGFRARDRSLVVAERARCADAAVTNAAGVPRRASPR